MMQITSVERAAWRHRAAKSHVLCGEPPAVAGEPSLTLRQPGG